MNTLKTALYIYKSLKKKKKKKRKKNTATLIGLHNVYKNNLKYT